MSTRRFGRSVAISAAMVALAVCQPAPTFETGGTELGRQLAGALRNPETTVLDLAGINRLRNDTGPEMESDFLTALPAGIVGLTRLEVLVLTHNRLETLPPEIGRLRALTDLYVDENLLNSLPAEVGSLPALRVLQLSGNLLRALPAEIGHLTQLEKLDLERNQLNDIGAAVLKLAGLRVLNLRQNRLAALNPGIASLSALTELEIGENGLTALPAEIGSLARLRRLSVASNHIAVLPPELGGLAVLEELNLARNPMTGLPPWIGNLSHLQSLDLSNCPLSTVPREIANLHELRYLDLSNTRIRDLPDEVLGLPSLTQLRLAGTAIPAARVSTLRTALPHTDIVASPARLTDLAQAVADPQHAESLDLSGQALIAVPGIGKLTELRILSLSKNRLAAFPPDLLRLPRLKELRLAGNSIHSLPPEICTSLHLESLVLDDNALTSLPDLSECISLRNLWVSGNRLRGLPAGLEKLRSLRSLEFSRNDLTPDEVAAIKQRFPNLFLSNYAPRTYHSIAEGVDVPDRVIDLDLSRQGLKFLDPAIASFTNLERLNLSDNPLARVPAFIERFSRLKYLDLTGDPIPPEALADLRQRLPNTRIDPRK